MRSGKTLACAYRASASPFAGVLTPRMWTEAHELVAAGLRPHDFTQGSVFGRLPRVGDLWAALRPAASARTKAAFACGSSGPRGQIAVFRTRSSAWIERPATKPITSVAKRQEAPCLLGESGAQRVGTGQKSAGRTGNGWQYGWQYECRRGPFMRPSPLTR